MSNQYREHLSGSAMQEEMIFHRIINFSQFSIGRQMEMTMRKVVLVPQILALLLMATGPSCVSPAQGLIRDIAVISIDGRKAWGAEKHTRASGTDDEKVIAALDTEYQHAVQKNDAATMDRLLADNFVLVTGSGKVYSKADLLQEAKSGQIVYERQEDSLQVVRVWGETAVVTAKLWAKGTESGKPFEYTLWFSDTYVHTSSGWRYVFGQASLPLPKAHQ
jgi:ketosteroid isomerase-like protein